MALANYSDSQQSPITILQLTDLHLLANPTATLRGIDTLASFRKTLDYALVQHPETVGVLLTGDLAEEPGSTTYQRLADTLIEYDLSFSCLPGNHDIYPDMVAVLNQNNYNCDKQFQIGNWQILMLNSQIPGSAGGNLANTEIEFIKHSLEQAPNQPTLIAVHHHCVSTHSLWMDTMRIKNSQELLDLLQHHSQVKAVLMGHIHQELDQQPGSLQLLGTPSTCFQFLPLSDTFAVNNKAPAYRWIKLNTDGQLHSGVNYLPNSF